MLWDFAYPLCWVRAPTMKKIGSLRQLLNFSKKCTPLPLPISFQKRCPSPFRPMHKRKLSLFRMASLNRVLLRTRYSMNERKSDGLGLIIPLTKGRDDLVMYCSQSLAHHGGCFWKEKERGMGDILKNSKMVVETQFFSRWELLHNMPGLQSLKALLLFVKEQCGFFPPLHHHRSCVLIPWPNWWPGVTRMEVLSSYKLVQGFQGGTVRHTTVEKIEKIRHGFGHYSSYKFYPNDLYAVTIEQCGDLLDCLISISCQTSFVQAGWAGKTNTQDLLQNKFKGNLNCIIHRKSWKIFFFFLHLRNFNI